MQSSRALPIGELHAAAVGASEASAAAREAAAAAAAAARASPSSHPVAGAAPHPKVFIDRAPRPATADASPTVRQARVAEADAAQPAPAPAPAPAPSAPPSRVLAPPLHRNASSLSHTCGAARGDALAAATEQQQEPGVHRGHGRGGGVDPRQREPPVPTPASTQAQMRSSVFSNGDEASTAQHATSKTLLRVAVAELPPHASAGEIKRRLGALGLEASDVRVQLNPLSGDASGRGEITFRNVADKRGLLDVLHRQPSALLHGRATQLLFDDTDHKHGRGGA